MSKKILFVFFAVIIFVFNLPVVALADSQETDISFPENDDQYMNHFHFAFKSVRDSGGQQRIEYLYITINTNAQHVSGYVQGDMNSVVIYADSGFTWSWNTYIVDYNGTAISGSQQGISISDTASYHLFNVPDSGSLAGRYDYIQDPLLILESDIYILKDKVDVLRFFETGEPENVVYSPTSKYNGQSVYLNNFHMVVHDSNVYDKYYVELKYSIPDSLKDSDNIFLVIDSTFHFDGEIVSGLFPYPFIKDGYPGKCSINIKDHPDGVCMYLDDFGCVQRYVADVPVLKDIIHDMILGDELFVDFSNFSIDGIGGETLLRVTTSDIYMDCTVVADGVQGVCYEGFVDFLNTANCSMSSYTPDDQGNYSYNGDYKQSEGYYYTEVTQDNFGNTQYNYYYYDNSTHTRQEISEPDQVPESSSGSGGVNVTNNPTFNNNITVEGDEINNQVENVVGDATNKEDNDSLVDKFLSFFDLLKNNKFLNVFSSMFSWIPSEVQSVITSAVAIGLVMLVWKAFRR